MAKHFQAALERETTLGLTLEEIAFYDALANNESAVRELGDDILKKIAEKLRNSTTVGYRVNSIRATQFRQWATGVLREFAIKGYVLDRQRMENGCFLGEDYFERLLAEIREIRLSERRFYQKITDIYATSLDYNKDAPTTKAFFAKAQTNTFQYKHKTHSYGIFLEPELPIKIKYP
ncbi:hypothetical protein BrE312_4533 [Brenneria sp. EniD312]|nr:MULTISPECIES: RhuM family protein [Brenneria]EHD23846.1 hypothetical protein BrE312_4533 [Brenneria sp. EniD312]